MKLFISQPMRGLSDHEIEERRSYLHQVACDLLKTDVGIIDSFFKGQDISSPLQYLGKSIELLSQADVVIFDRGWSDARGCKIEHECAVSYGIPTIEYVGEDSWIYIDCRSL